MATVDHLGGTPMSNKSVAIGLANVINKLEAERDSALKQRDEWRDLYQELCDKYAKAVAPPVTYQPCPKHHGMSMLFRTTAIARPAMPVCPGCNPPPNLIPSGHIDNRAFVLDRGLGAGRDETDDEAVRGRDAP
jgi:hypothetical protein